MQTSSLTKDVSDEELSLEELENMYDKTLNSFEPLEEKEKEH